MMLTLKQPVYHGFHTAHDIPTPPSTSRSTPPVTVQESFQKPLPALTRRNSPPPPPPPSQAMSAPHRGLPLPGAMTLPPPGSGPQPPGLPPAPGPLLHSQGPPPQSQLQQQQPPPPPPPPGHMMGALPAPPQWQGPGADESMRSWLAAKTEEERRKQEEEKTHQEKLRLEQRKLEHEMLRTSLERGIPPSMVPVVFAGMGGGALPQAALEWAQSVLSGQPQAQAQAQIMATQGPLSPEHRRRDSQSQPYAHYAGSIGGVPSTPGSAPGPQGGFVPYQGPNSPTRARAHTMSVAGTVGRPLGGALPRLSTSEMLGGPSGVPHHFGPQQAAPPPPQQQQPPQQPPSQQAQPQQDTQSPSIYFHHWQPPASQANSNQPATPSDSPRKRKATGPQPAAPAPNSQIRNRSPPFSHFGGPSTLGNPPPGRRRGHSRQRSDISAYRSTRGGRGDSYGPSRPMSPGLGHSEGPLLQRGTHSVSSLLSDHPSPRYPASDMRSQGESDRRQSPLSADEKMRGTGVGPGAARERDND